MNNNDVYKMVTDKILEQLDKGVIPWERGWAGRAGNAVSHNTGRSYSFVNQMLLGGGGEWVTFSECTKEGGKVRKGEHGSMIVFWKQIAATVDSTDENGNLIKEKKLIPMLKYYTVFEVGQCEGIERKYDDGEVHYPNGAESDAAAEKIIRDYRNRENLHLNRIEQDRAYYSPSLDLIVTPTIVQFESTAEYYSTTFHEMTHSTGHPARLNRFTGDAANAAFGSKTYSKEELIAEMGAAYLTTVCGLSTERSERNSAAYIDGWRRVISSNPKLVVTAAGKAEKAADFILTGKRPEKIANA